MFHGSGANTADVQASPSGPHPPTEESFVDNSRGGRLSFVSQIDGQLRLGVVIDQVRNRDDLFRLTIPGFVDRYSQAIAGLPCVFHIGILQDGSDDRFAANTPSLGYVIPPEEFPTSRSSLSMAKPKISSLIARSHFPDLL
jgi:hypothetical protein